MDSNKEAILPPNRVIFHEIATLSHSSLVPFNTIPLTQMLEQKVEKFMTTKIFCGCIERRKYSTWSEADSLPHKLYLALRHHNRREAS